VIWKIIIGLVVVAIVVYGVRRYARMHGWLDIFAFTFIAVSLYGLIRLTIALKGAENG